MSSLKEFAKSERKFQNAKRNRVEHPKGWEPGLDTSKKEIVSKPMSKAMNPKDHKWDKYLEDLGFNPAEIVSETLINDAETFLNEPRQ